MHELILTDLIERALYEDLGRGDITSEAIVPPGLGAHAVIRAKQAGIIAGLEVARLCFQRLSPDVRWQASRAEGRECAPGEPVATVVGPALALLAAERVALNFLQRLSGIATATRQMVEAVAPYGAHIIDTRKTLPGLRSLDKYAVRVGGGRNHRFGLDDGVLIKDNHIAVAGGIVPALQRARQGLGHMVKVEIEVTTLDQLAEALAVGVDAVLLDNMSLDAMREAVALTAGRCLLEASGNITLTNCQDIAATGVNLLSVGGLTHSVTALDLSMLLTIGGVAARA